MTGPDFQWIGQGFRRSAAIFLIVAAAACFRSSPPGMVWIKPGPFQMGTDVPDTDNKGLEFGQTKPWFEDESPVRQVDLPGYYIDRTEVTNRDYAEYVLKSRSLPPPSWKDGAYPEGRENFPVADVNWYQADAYCRWLNKRLPTEAEWEKAARGTEGLTYPWGNRFEEGRANLLTGGPQAVGSFPRGASPYGVEDMIGNVWEWTADWYAPYPGNSLPSDYYGNRYKVIRGKSWTEGYGHFSKEDSEEIMEHEARSSYRLFFDPKFTFGDLGFRCAKDA